MGMNILAKRAISNRLWTCVDCNINSGGNERFSAIKYGVFFRNLRDGDIMLKFSCRMVK